MISACDMCSAPADFWTVLTAISGTAAALLRGKDGSLSSSTSTKAGRDAIERLTSPLLRRLFTAATASQASAPATTAHTPSQQSCSGAT